MILPVGFIWWHKFFRGLGETLELGKSILFKGLTALILGEPIILSIS